MLIYVFFIFIQAVRVSGDYECLCNFHSSRLDIYNKPDNNSQILGTLQRFSCKPTNTSGGQGMWKAIRYEQQIGFVLTDLFTVIQNCQGSPHHRSMATTPVTTKSTTQLTASATSTFPHGDVSKCPTYVRNDATNTHSYLGQYDQYCFVLYPHATNWANAAKLCRLRGGQLLMIRNAKEQNFFTNYFKSHNYTESAYMGLIQSVKGGRYMWLTGAPLHYTNWSPDYYASQRNHTIDGCVVMKANGQWDDAGCGLGLVIHFGHYDHETHHFICQYGFDARPTHIGSIIGRRRK